LQDAPKMAGAHKIVTMCAGIHAGERVLVLTDTATLKVGEMVAAAALQVSAETVLAVIAPRSDHGQEPPVHIAAAMAESDVILMPQAFSMTHAQATKRARKNGARVLSMGDYNEEMLARGGIEADFLSLKPAVQKVADLFSKSDTVHLTSPGGTDLHLDIRGRHGFCEPGFTHEPGGFVSPPNVEANVGPLEGTSHGTLVVDASISHPSLGLITEPIRITVEKGLVTAIEGGAQAAILRDLLAAIDDPGVYNIAELGIGLNPCARVSGSMMEDEGAYGTSHIGIGNNLDFEGHVDAKTHLDLIMHRSTMVLDGEYVLQEEGRLAFALTTERNES